MSLQQRFIARSAIGIWLLCASIGVLADQKWKELVEWNHSWDAVDATTYVDDGKDYKMPSAVRVDYVTDHCGGRNLMRDKGGILSLYKLPLLPGPLYQSSNSMFGGRPSWFSDTLIPHNPEQKGYFYSIQSMLSMEHDRAVPSTLLRWPQPWWGAVLVRGVGPFGGHNQAYIDGDPGMTTISRSKRGTVMVRAWTAGFTFGPEIDSGAPYEEETALVMWQANGENSWLEVNYRNSDGALVTRRVNGAIGGRDLDNLHSGLSHTNYTSAIGIAKGIPTTTQTDAVRNWAAPFVPAPESQ